ncbi:MAG: hypothetical protein M3511_11655, partial [Deinococcota bacterium]|nr:hypothetical protein [Deinococcota bacterium]
MKVQALQSIPLNRSFPIEVLIENAAPEEVIAISFDGMAGLTPSIAETTVRADLRGSARLELEAVIATAGYSALIVNAEVSGHRLADTLDIVFDAPGTRLAAQNLGASEQEGSSIEQEEYVDSLPRVFDTAYVNWYELEDSSFVPPDDETADPSVTVVVEGIQYETEDGSLTEPRFAVEYLAPNTGEGEPTYEDLYTERSVSGPPE